MTPAPCVPEARSATVMECYDTQAVAEVESGSRYWQDLVKEDRPAFDLSSTVVLVVLVSVVATFIAHKVRRDK